VADTLDQIAEHVEAMNRDCVPSCEHCRRQRIAAILHALREARADALRDAADAFEALSKRRDILPPTFGEVAQSLRARATEASKGGQ
jgi:hypothetical protein